MDSASFKEHLDGRALAFIRALKRRLMEAMSGHTDDKSHTNDSASVPCCGRKVSSSFLNFVGEICRLVIYDPPAALLRGGGGSKLRDGNFDLFP